MEKSKLERLFNQKKVIDKILDENEKIRIIASQLNISVEELKKAYAETGDMISAELQVQERSLLGSDIADTITLNGNIIPEELYDRITEAANLAIFFKQNRESLVKTITSLQDGDTMLLSPLQIAQLLVNVSKEDKPLFTEEDQELINELGEEAQLYTAEEAKGILKFLESKRLPSKDNTDLYNRLIESIKSNYKYETLLTENRTLVRTNKRYKDDKPASRKLEYKERKMNR